MRRLGLLIAFASLTLVGQESALPSAGSPLLEYQRKALENGLQRSPGPKTFDPRSLPMEKILSAVEQRGCAIPLLEANGDRHIDGSIRTKASPTRDPMPPLRLMPVCSSSK